MRVGIIGGGISGLMAAYRLAASESVSVTIFEKGRDLKDRSCPMLQKKSEVCLKCNHCSIMEGLAGAGAFSDGKYNITTEYGGWLADFRGEEETMKYIQDANKVLGRFGSVSEYVVYEPDNELKKLCMQHDLHMLQGKCKHLGTDANYETMLRMTTFLKNHPRVNIETEAEVLSVAKKDDIFSVMGRKKGSGFLECFDQVIFAVGRVGSGFFAKWCEDNGIRMRNNQVDVGVRVELPAMVWDEFEKKIYEPKIHYRSKQYGDITRMFCFNGRGEVVTENTNGILTVNGHAYHNEKKKTENTNFALLSTSEFTYPFYEPIEYAKHVAKLANMLGGGSVLVQRLGDLEKGRRTTQKRLDQSYVKPTLKAAVPGDLSLCLPKRQLDNIIETLHALDKIAPGTANEDTLLYGVECKYYSARPETDAKFELLKIKNVYAVGDGAGFTRSLSQAAAQGLMVADEILKKCGAVE